MRNRSIGLLTIVLLASAWLLTPGLEKARAHAPGVSLSAFTQTAPTIDGIIDSAEWAAADSLDFVTIQGSFSGTINVMNDDANLYIALAIADTSLTPRILLILFDDDHDGILEVGEDLFHFNTFVDGIPFDGFTETLTPVAFGPGADIGFGGTTDGSLAAISDGSFNRFEFSHPLCSSDTSHDFCLSHGEATGFLVRYLMFGLGDDWPAQFGFPANFDASQWGDIHVGIPVDIDVKPGSDPNSINVKSTGVVPVAILTMPGFDAATVDPPTVRFGRTGTEAAAAIVPPSLEDVDGDGDLDRVLMFNVQETGIQAGDTQATLTGKTFDGSSITGTDSVRAFFPGDVDGDLQVTIIDAGIGAYAFSSTPESPRWNPNADFNENGIIDIMDFGMIALNFGQHA